MVISEKFCNKENSRTCESGTSHTDRTGGQVPSLQNVGLAFPEAVCRIHGDGLSRQLQSYSLSKILR